MRRVDKLDKIILGLLADGKRVIKRCPKLPRPSNDTLVTYCSRSVVRNPKRRAEEMADENAKRSGRRIVSLANRSGGRSGAAESRKEDEQPAKSMMSLKKKPANPTIQPTKKTVPDGATVEDIEDSPLQERPIAVIQPKAQAKGPTGSDVSILGIVYRANQWIEQPSGKIPDEVSKRFVVPNGRSQDRWQPQLDISRNESIFIDDSLHGGNLGYRLLRNLATPVDRLAGLVGPVVAQYMHDLMKVVAFGTELVEMYRYYQEQHHQTTLN
uniref:Uncharacterized protein n=1 Tax=Chenopodium quinoa TaxID=63459 RepID=A0A803MA35_CHEQI